MRFWACLVVLAGCDRLLRLDDIMPHDAAVATTWAAVSAGGVHTCGIRSDGSLWCWGSDSDGQLGLGLQIEVDQPTQVGSARWSAVSAGGLHTCGLQSDGSLWCWGRSMEGETGVGNTGTGGSIPLPTQVSGTWLAVSAGGQHTCAVRDDHSLWCWGQNISGQLGNPLLLVRPSPVQVPAPTGSWSQVTAGYDHTCALADDGSLYCWGDNASSQLGDGTSIGRTYPTLIDKQPWSRIAASYAFTCGIQAGHLRCWGEDAGATPTPITVLGADADGWIDVAVGNDYTMPPTMCARRADGFVLCWGDNRRGLLGPLGAGTQFATEPVLLQTGPSTVATISLGNQHACLIGNDQTLWCLGSDSYGQLGDGVGSHRTPTQVPGTWSAPACGARETCALDAQGHPACTGENDDGELGDGTTIDRDTFAPVAGGASSSQLALGFDNSFALTASGQLWAWGEAQYGTLGNGTTAPSLDAPQAVATQPLSQIAASDHACGIDMIGDLYCWGRNDSGQLGIGGTNGSAGPVQVGPTTTWSAVATGGLHTCGISASGAYCWGRGDSGQLGNGLLPTYADTPQSLANATFVAVTCGYAHSCAIAKDRLAWCWGDGNHGQLGVGGLGQLLYPNELPVVTWRKLAAGGYHTCGIQSDGSLWCWGLNSNGQLGDGTLESRDTPALVGDPTDTTWTDISAGFLHTCATKSDHTLWCWGFNMSGQLGDGTAWRAQAIQIP